MLVFATGFSACLATWPMGLDPSPSDDQPVVTTANPSPEGFAVDDADEREEEEREDDRSLLVTLDGRLVPVESECDGTRREQGSTGPSPHRAGAPRAIRGPPRHDRHPGV